MAVALFQSSNNERRLARAREWIKEFDRECEIRIVATTLDAAREFTRHPDVVADARFGLTATTVKLLASELASLDLADREVTPLGFLAAEAVMASGSQVRSPS